MAFKAKEIVYCVNGAAFQGLGDSSGHKQKVVGELKSVSWGGAQTKGNGHEFKLTKIRSCTVIC